MSSLKLGPFEIPHPFILAPMAGITNSPFRRLMKRRGSALVVSELVSANGLEYGGERTEHLLRYDEEERIVGIQIFGEREDLLVKACVRVEALGADFVDLNLGCPVPKVVKKGAGSAMCRDPIALGKTLKKMVDSVKIPVTIKIRTGWNNEEVNASEVIQAATDAGVSWVAVHGRTRAQGYSGNADWDFIGELKAKSSIPIIGNGDLNTAEAAVERYKDYGVDAVMIGRGALRNPFIFEQSDALLNQRDPIVPSTEAYLDLILGQRDLLEESYGSRMAMIHGRKFLSWYAAGFPGCHEFRKNVFQSPDGDTLWKIAGDFFVERVHLRNQEFLAQPFLMGGHG